MLSVKQNKQQTSVNLNHFISHSLYTNTTSFDTVRFIWYSCSYHTFFIKYGTCSFENRRDLYFFQKRWSHMIIEKLCYRRLAAYHCWLATFHIQQSVQFWYDLVCVKYFVEYMAIKVLQKMEGTFFVQKKWRIHFTQNISVIWSWKFTFTDIWYYISVEGLQ